MKAMSERESSAQRHEGAHRGLIERLALFLFAEAFCLGMVVPALPSLLEGSDSIGRGSDTDGFSVVTTGALLFASYAAAQFVSAPIIGRLSDRIDRRVFVQASLGTAAASYLVLAMAETSGPMLTARAVAGFAGSVWLPANSAIGVIIVPKERPSAFAKLGGASALGFILGPVAGGIFAQFGDTLPVWLAAFLSGIAFVASGLFLNQPEKIDNTRFENLSLVVGKHSGIFGRHFPQIAALFLVQLVFRSQPFLWPFYLTVVFGLNSAVVGLAVGTYALSMLLTQLFAAGRLSAMFGPRRVCIGGLAIGGMVYGSMVVVTETLVLPIAAAMGFAAALIIPTFQAFITREVASNRQGQLQGLISSTIALASMAGPLLMASLLPGGGAGASVPESPFLAAAALLICAMLLVARSGTANLQGAHGS